LDCSQIQRALLAGEAHKGPELDAHLAGCESCRFLMGDGVPVAQALGRGSAGVALPAELGLLEARVLSEIAAEKGWLTRLRERPRLVRMAPLIVLLALEALFMATYLRRGDWSTYPPGRLAVTAGGYAVIALGLAWLALRPLYLRPVPDWARNAIVATAIALPFVIAALPGPPTMAIATFTYPGFTFRCFAYGSALGLAIILLGRALDRGGHQLDFAALVAAAAGGYAGLMGLHIECPVNDPLHLLTAHATLPVGLALGSWLFRRA
jgi:hypothetical protein